MANPSAVFTELVSTTMRHRKRKVVDNLTNNNALLALMKRRGNIKTSAAGGTEIVVPLMYAENSTYQRYSGLDVLNVGQSDVITSAKYDWKQVAMHVTSSGRELRVNNSKEQMINLAEVRVEAATATAANQFSVDIYSDGSLTNQIGGLAHTVQSGGQGTVGGINAANYAFWQNKVREMSAPGTFSALKADMNALWLQLVRGNDKPDLVVLTHDLYAVYEGGLQDLQRYGDAAAAGLGFEALKYKTSSVIFDDNANFGTTAELGYFLNTKYVYLHEHPEARWTEDTEKRPTNQDGVIIPIYWMGEFCVSNRALQGKLVDLA